MDLMNYYHTLKGARLERRTLSISFSVYFTLLRRLSISAKRTTRSAIYSCIRFWRATWSERDKRNSSRSDVWVSITLRSRSISALRTRFCIKNYVPFRRDCLLLEAWLSTRSFPSLSFGWYSAVSKIPGKACWCCIHKDLPLLVLNQVLIGLLVFLRKDIMLLLQFLILSIAIIEVFFKWSQFEFQLAVDLLQPSYFLYFQTKDVVQAFDFLQVLLFSDLDGFELIGSLFEH